MADPNTAQAAELSAALDLLAAWHDGYVNGMSPDEFEALMTRTGTFLTDCDPGDEDDSYGHGV